MNSINYNQLILLYFKFFLLFLFNIQGKGKRKSQSTWSLLLTKVMKASLVKVRRGQFDEKKKVKGQFVWQILL